MAKNHPIGIFDSGYGGLSIFKEIETQLPQYDYIYLGDNARAPYGDKSFEEVYDYTLESVKWFLRRGCTLVILACNTASAKALRNIQQHVLPGLGGNKRVLGIIRPTSEIIGNLSRTKHVGILATAGTVKSESYVLEIQKFFPDTIVTQLACPEWVGLVENNLHQSPEAHYWVQKYLSTALEKDSEIDTLLLACTHYPLLLPVIEQYTPAGVKIISQGQIIAGSLRDYLLRHPELPITKNGSRVYFTTGDPQAFNAQGSVFFGKAIESVGVNNLSSN